MGLPAEPVCLTPEEVAALNRRLSDMRHNVNNHLTLVTTALELMRRKPDAIPRLLASLAEQPQKIKEEVSRFSDDFEQTLKITRT